MARAARYFGDAKTAHFCLDLAFCLVAYARVHRAVSGTVSIVAKFVDTAENEILKVWLVSLFENMHFHDEKVIIWPRDQGLYFEV